MKKYFKIFIIFCSITLCITSISKLPDKELENIVIAHFKINFTIDKLEEILKDKRYLNDNYEMKKMYDKIMLNLNDEKRIIIKEIELEGYFKDKIKLFQLGLTNFENIYTIAVSPNGSVYYLNGFRAKNFGNFIKGILGKVDNEEEALLLSKFYLSFFEPELITDRIIIDSSNLKQFKLKYPQVIDIVKFSNGKNDVHIAITTLEDSIGRVIRHYFDFSDNNFKYYNILFSQDKPYIFD